MPKARTLSEIKSNLLHPSTTSHFEVEIPMPKKLSRKYLSDNGINLDNNGIEKLRLLCAEASLPGSSFATLELNNDYTGVTERHAYRRIYDDRIDFTFYVDAETYLPIRIFETWMKFIAQEASVAGQPDKGGMTSRDKAYFYRFNYPDDYMLDEGMKVIKFERSSYTSKRNRASTIEYEFIRAYPISVSSMPVSYESSSLLKCTVSMTYIRYILNRIADPPPPNVPAQSPSIKQQAAFNTAAPQSIASYGNTYGPGTDFTFRDAATGERADGKSDGPLLTTRQALGLDPR